MTWVLIAAPFVVALALACGFALGRLMPRADDFFSPEDARDLRQRVWERHWAENAAREQLAQTANSHNFDRSLLANSYNEEDYQQNAARLAQSGLVQPDDPGLGHTHADH